MSGAEHRFARRVRLGAAWTAIAVIAQGLLLAWRYPAAPLDADLLSYLVYYRGLASGGPVLFGYTVPKVLPVFLLGPLGDPMLALASSIAIAALGGALLFAVAARALGLGSATIAALLYVLDPMRSVLTLRSGVDLYIGVALLCAVFALQRGAVLVASGAILVAALGKPVAALCALAILVVPGVGLRRRSVALALPLAAIPASSMLAAALDGRSVWRAAAGLALPDQHERFVRVAQGVPRDLGGSLHLLLVEWFGGTLFARTWPLAVLGVALYVTAALRGRWAGGPPARAAGGGSLRLGPVAPGPALGRRAVGRAVDPGAFLLLVPALLCAAYLGLSILRPMVVFTRFFWPLALALGVLAGHAAWTLARLAPGSRAVGGALLALLVAALLADRWDDHRWRERIMLAPFETHAWAASEAVEVLARGEVCRGAALVPLAYLPLAAWRAPGKLGRGELCAAEDWADGRGCAAPTCVLFIPDAPTTARAREAVAELVGRGFVVEVGNEHGALVRASRG